MISAHIQAGAVSPEELAASAAASAPTLAPYEDPAEPILNASPLSDDVRAQAWDIFHNAQSPEDLARDLSPLDIPDSVKRGLFAAKNVTATALGPVDKIKRSLTQMSRIDPKVLATAEKFPTVAKAMIGAATTKGD